MVADIKTLNGTAPTRYYKNDLLFFTWSVKIGNFSYESSKDVKIVFILSNATIVAGSGIDLNGEGNSKVESTTSSGQPVIEYTLTNTDFSIGNYSIIKSLSTLGK